MEKTMTEIKNRVMFSEMVKIKQPEDLRDMIARVLKQGLEGLVLKDLQVRIGLGWVGVGVGLG